MRLTRDEIDAIKAAAHEAFGEGAVVRLFGSRVHDHLRGGDIDLLIELPGEVPGIAVESRFFDDLFARIDERKVDLVLTSRQQPPSTFARLVAPGAVLLS